MDEPRPLRGRVVLSSGATAVVTQSGLHGSTISIVFQRRSVGTVFTPTSESTYDEIDRLRALFTSHRPETVDDARQMIDEYVGERGYPTDGSEMIRAVPTPHGPSRIAFNTTAPEYLDFRRLLWARLGSTLGTWSALSRSTSSSTTRPIRRCG